MHHVCTLFAVRSVVDSVERRTDALSLKNMTVQPVSVFLIKNRKGGVHNMLSLHDLTCGLDPETGPETGFWRISLQLLTMKPAEDIHDLQRMNLFSLTSPSGQFSTPTQ